MIDYQQSRVIAVEIQITTLQTASLSTLSCIYLHLKLQTNHREIHVVNNI